MARVKCDSHRYKDSGYFATPFEPVGYPNSGLICGAKGCEEPGLVWLTVEEEREYRSAGKRIFCLNPKESGVKFHVTDSADVG